MAERRPLVIVGGEIRELAVGDSLPSGLSTITNLSSSYLDLNYSGWGTLATGIYYLSGLGSAWSNKPIDAFMTLTATYLGIFRVINNASFHSVQVEFSSTNDTLFTANRVLERANTTLATAITSGWSNLAKKEYETTVRWNENASATTAGATKSNFVTCAGTTVFATDLSNVFDANSTNGTIRYLGLTGLKAIVTFQGTFIRASGSSATNIRFAPSLNADTPTNAMYSTSDVAGTNIYAGQSRRVITLTNGDIITARAATTNINWVLFSGFMRLSVQL